MQGSAVAATVHERTPVSRIGIAVMGTMLAIVLVNGIVRNGLLQALGDLGFRSPPIALYTLLLLSPLFFESAYPWLSRKATGRGLAVVENLHRHAPYLILIGLTMLGMRLENVYDLDLTAWLGWDATPWVYGLEGDVVGQMQSALRHPALDLFFIFIYVTVYALYHAVALFGFAAAGRTAMVKRMAVAWITIYAVALPFYILMPVNEVWVTNAGYGCGYDYSQAVGVLNDECGSDSGIVYAISSINNCFPSLHNAFAWALPFLLWRSGWVRAARATGVVAFLVSFATVYLGIHWITDLVAGILLSWFAVALAMKLEYRVTPSLKVTGLGWNRRGLAHST